MLEYSTDLEEGIFAVTELLEVSVQLYIGALEKPQRRWAKHQNWTHMQCFTLTPKWPPMLLDFNLLWFLSLCLFETRGSLIALFSHLLHLQHNRLSFIGYTYINIYKVYIWTLGRFLLQQGATSCCCFFSFLDRTKCFAEQCEFPEVWWPQTQCVDFQSALSVVSLFVFLSLVYIT